MVKLATVTVAVISIITPVIAARNCKTGLNYCGYNLLGRGAYDQQVEAALKASNQPTDQPHTNESLFHCNGGPHGDVTFRAYCSGGCQDGGGGKNDFC